MPTHGRLVDSAQYLGDSARLSKIVQDDGYLFFRRLLDPAQVLTVKQEIMAILREHHIIENDGATDPMWCGGPHPTETEYMAFYDKIVRLDCFNQLAESPAILDMLKGILGGPVQAWTQRLIRVMYPEPEAQVPIGVGAHQDGNTSFGYKAQEFITSWLPLMDIEGQLGGLAIAPGSHKQGLLDHEGGAAASSAERVKKNKVFGLDTEDFTWATIDFHPGDAVFFSSLTAHRGLVNHADRIRLSCDFRYQREGEPASWIAHTPGPDVRRVAQQIDEIIAGRALYVTTHATKETLDEVRRRMLEEKSASLERARELAVELGASR